MTYDYIRTAQQALVYMTECTLATVEYMASLKKKNMSEYRRQVSLAQKGVDMVIAFRCEPGGRVDEVIDKYVCKVADWTRAIDPKFKEK